MPETLLPTERSVFRGVAALRWGALVWSAVVLVVNLDRVKRPVVVAVVVAAAAVVTVTASVALERTPVTLLRPWFIGTELLVGFALLATDGWGFDSLSGRQSLAGFWPLVGVLHGAIVFGPWLGGAIGGTVSLGRFAGLSAAGEADLTAHRLMSLLATAVFYVAAGMVSGWVARLLRRAEHEVAGTRAREEVARTLHDGVLQTLALVGRRTATTDPDLAYLARTTDRDLRAFLFGANRAQTGDLATALRATADRVGRDYDLPVTVSVLDDDLEPTAAAVDALTGAVGEALVNVAKHAGATRAVVFAQADPDGEVFVSVRDDGSGFDPGAVPAGGGEGLRRSVRGRVEELGGRVEIDSAGGRGTEVRLWL